MGLKVVKVLVNAEKIVELARFYAAVTGMTTIWESDGWTEIEFGTAAIGFDSGGDASKEVWTSLSFTVDSLSEFGTAVEAAGGAVVEAPYDPEEGPFRLATYRDPENNLFMAREDT